MGLFGLFGKKAAADSPEKKSLVWFSGEDGKSVYNKYMAKYDEMCRYRDKLDLTAFSWVVCQSTGDVYVNANKLGMSDSMMSGFMEWPTFYFKNYSPDNNNCIYEKECFVKGDLVGEARSVDEAVEYMTERVQYPELFEECASRIMDEIDEMGGLAII